MPSARALRARNDEPVTAPASMQGERLSPADEVAESTPIAISLLVHCVALRRRTMRADARRSRCTAHRNAPSRPEPAASSTPRSGSRVRCVITLCNSLVHAGSRPLARGRALPHGGPAGANDRGAGVLVDAVGFGDLDGAARRASRSPRTPTPEASWRRRSPRSAPTAAGPATGSRRHARSPDRHDGDESSPATCQTTWCARCGALNVASHGTHTPSGSWRGRRRVRRLLRDRTRRHRHARERGTANRDDHARRERDRRRPRPARISHPRRRRRGRRAGLRDDHGVGGGVRRHDHVDSHRRWRRPRLARPVGRLDPGHRDRRPRERSDRDRLGRRHRRRRARDGRRRRAGRQRCGDRRGGQGPRRRRRRRRHVERR